MKRKIFASICVLISCVIFLFLFFSKETEAFPCLAKVPGTKNQCWIQFIDSRDSNKYFAIQWTEKKHNNVLFMENIRYKPGSLNCSENFGCLYKNPTFPFNTPCPKSAYSNSFDWVSLAPPEFSSLENISHLKEMVSNGKNIAMRSYIPKEVFSSQEKVIIGNLQFSNNGDFSVLNSTDTSFVSYARCFVVL
ncbi:MAG: hypothetical protein J6A06_01370 [Fibrobacteraceae bacterium]|nr:hypothetical protein [Fibrobacteraceae bacterium]